MKIPIRSYNHEQDFERVSQFLIESYRPGDVVSPWLQARWEYMHYHPFILKLDRTKIGLVEDRGKVVGVCTFESNQGEIYPLVHPDYRELRFQLVEYAEQTNFSGISRSTGRLFRVVYIEEFDRELEEFVKERGFEKWAHFDSYSSMLSLEKPIPECTLPEGFRLQSLADENDLEKVNRVMWRGFDHPGPPPEEELEGRAFMQSAPNFRKDLTIVAVAPDGNYASFSGMWHIKANKVAYVEPVATDPDYRRMGLGKAAVLESIRRAAAEGAVVAWVGADLEFYLAMGFEKKCRSFPWAKFLD
jgi:GNAT superfamily N-acetyltransferase